MSITVKSGKGRAMVTFSRFFLLDNSGISAPTKTNQNNDVSAASSSVLAIGQPNKIPGIGTLTGDHPESKSCRCPSMDSGV